MTKTSTDQHYVPQLLLRSFAIPQTKQVYVFDKQTDKVFRSSVRKLAYERGFYDLEGEDPKRLDRWLTQLENQVGPVIVSIRDRQALDHLSLVQRECLALFIAVQHVRTRHRIESWADMNHQLADAIRERGTDPSSVRNFREMSYSELRLESIASMPTWALNLLPHLLNKTWVLLANAPRKTFWIADHPVVLANNTNPSDGIRSTLGFAVRGIEVYLPISSRLTLGCLCPTIREVFEASGRRLAKQTFGTSPASELLAAMTGHMPWRLQPENMEYHNSLQVRAAERFVFSGRNDFEMAKEIIAKHPPLRTGPRMEIAGRDRKSTFVKLARR